MRPEKHLSLDASAADFAIDVSNVVRAPQLGGDRGADLDRFIRLLAGLVAYTKDESVQVYPVADRSLLRDRELTDAERATLRRWYRDGLIEVLDVADDRLLELADATGLPVVSRDNYLEYHRAYPWISGNRDRFFQPVPTPDGGVSVLPRIMPVPQEWEISRKEEESLLLAAGLYDRRGGSGPRRNLLTRLWRCPIPDCPMFGPERTGGQPLPVYRQGVVRCPAHRAPLIDLGFSPRRAQVKVRVGGTVRTRFVLAAGSQVTVGRAPGPSGITLAPWLAATALEISRSHAVLHWDGTVLSVTDTSTNGTWARRPGRRPVRLARGRPWRARKGDEFLLGDGVALVVSGREFVVDEAAAGPPATAPDGVPDRETARATRVWRIPHVRP